MMANAVRNVAAFSEICLRSRVIPAHDMRLGQTAWTLLYCVEARGIGFTMCGEGPWNAWCPAECSGCHDSMGEEEDVLGSERSIGILWSKKVSE